MRALVTVFALSAVGVFAIAAPKITDAPSYHLNQIQRRQDLNDKESACLTDTVYSILLAAPVPTDPALSSWVEESYVVDIPTVTHFDQVDSVCSSAMDPSLVTPPASLASEFSAFLDEEMAWRKSFHAEAHSIAEDCGKVGPVILAAVATDIPECVAAFNELGEEFPDQAEDIGWEPNSAARQTGVLAAAAVVGGFVGIIALL